MDTLEKTIVGLDSAIYREKEGVLYKYILEAVEKTLIEQALERTAGNQLEAARLLGINRNTIRSKIRKLGIDVSRWKII